MKANHFKNLMKNADKEIRRIIIKVINDEKNDFTPIIDARTNEKVKGIPVPLPQLIKDNSVTPFVFYDKDDDEIYVVNERFTGGVKGTPIGLFNFEARAILADCAIDYKNIVIDDNIPEDTEEHIRAKMNMADVGLIALLATIMH